MPALLAAPAAGATPLWLTNARLLDGTGAAPRDGASVLVRDGRVEAIGGAGEQPPPDASTVDLEGRTLMPGLIDAHAHVLAKLPAPAEGTEPLLPGTAAHAEGLAGTEIAIEEGIDTIEHGMYLNQRPDLLGRMAAAGQVLVPTFSCFYGVAGLGESIAVDGDGPRTNGGRPPAPTWSPLLVELAEYNLEQAGLTLRAARAAGVPIACGHDWSPLWNGAIEILRMIHHGLTAQEALIAATATAASALGLGDQVGTVEPGRLADLLVLDGDPFADPVVLRDRDRIWMVLQLGEPVAGTALEADPRDTRTAAHSAR